MFGITATILSGATSNFPEEPETAQEDMREIGSSFVLYTSRLWESLCSTIRAKTMDTSFIKKFLYDIFLPVGYKKANLGYGEKLNPFWKVQYWIATQAVFRPLRDKIGLLKTRIPIGGGSMMSPDILRYFRAIGVDLRHGYGCTEAGFCAVHIREDDIKYESIGVPLPGVEARISGDGELWWKGDIVFTGYYKMPEKTKEAFTDDGWWRSGDAANIDEDGHIIYLDRMEYMLHLSSGAKYSPSYLEASLKFSPRIRDVFIAGGEYISALIQIDYEILGRWAERHQLPYTTFVDLSQKPEIYDLIGEDIMKVNRSLPEAARVKKFVCLPKEFDPDEAELTRTRKLRREFVEAKYVDIIDAIYQGKETGLMKTEVKYRDGRKGNVERQFSIRTLF